MDMKLSRVTGATDRCCRFTVRTTTVHSLFRVRRTLFCLSALCSRPEHIAALRAHVILGESQQRCARIDPPACGHSDNTIHLS